MISFQVFTGIALVFGFIAAWAQNKRTAILALWMVGVWIGAAFLSVGAEFLALVQWISSTVIVLSFVFFALMFGEFEAPKAPAKGGVPWILAVPVAASWLTLIGVAASGLGSDLAAESTAQPLVEMGRQLLSEHWVAIEVLGILLFLSIVGAGVVARPDQADDRGGRP